MVREQLSDIEAMILDVIASHQDLYGFSPSVRELAEITHRSSSTVQYHLQRMVVKGWITRYPKVARSIQIVKTEALYDTSAD